MSFGQRQVIRNDIVIGTLTCIPKGYVFLVNNAFSHKHCYKITIYATWCSKVPAV